MVGVKGRTRVPARIRQTGELVERVERMSPDCAVECRVQEDRMHATQKSFGKEPCAGEEF